MDDGNLIFMRSIQVHQSTERTMIAFNEFRNAYSLRMPPREAIANRDECKQMCESDGLEIWFDGDWNENDVINKASLEMLSPGDLVDRRLWAVRRKDTAHAAENCAFGKSLETGKIKHTNLTGGAEAFCSGELIFLNANTIIINGCSQRYGPLSSGELLDVALAFKKSGYCVAVMGFEPDSGRPLPFIGTAPSWV